MEKMLLSVQDIIEALGVSRSTAYNLMHRADFPQRIQIGRRVFVPAAELREWISNGGTEQRAKGA